MDRDQNTFYCRDLVRTYDRERYVTALFAPATRRVSLWAIAAFNHEIAKTRETVSEPMLGEIRLQWWREAIDEIYEATPRRHAVVGELASAIELHSLDRTLFDSLIDARAEDLAEHRFATTEAFLGYIERTVRPFYRLWLAVLDADNGPAIETSALIARAYGITGILRAAPFFFAQNRVLLPQDTMRLHGLTERQVFSLRSSEALCAVVSDLLALAEQDLARAREAGAGVSRTARPVLLAAAQTRWHIARLRQEECDPYRPVVGEPLPFHELRLAYRNLLGRWW